jgi:hypothetical protein
LNKFIVFDNGGATADRFTIINDETGDVFGAGENTEIPNGAGKYIGNCAAHRIALYGSGWRQRIPTKKIIREEIDNYINNARLDPNWIGVRLDIAILPETVRQYIAYIDSQGRSAERPTANIVYMPKISGILNSATTTK